jgi:uncharacterized protein YlxW (UPF0749 family)
VAEQHAKVEVVRLRNGARWGLILSVATMMLGLMANALVVGLSYGSLSQSHEGVAQDVALLRQAIERMEVREDDLAERITRIEQKLDSHIRNTNDAVR